MTFNPMAVGSDTWGVDNVPPLKGDKVLYEGEVVGVFGPMEYEYSNGKFQKEISVVQKSFYYDEMTVKIAHFLSIRFPKSKIEVKVPRDDQLDRF